MARLVVVEGKAPEPIRHLGEFSCTVGRLASCGLQLEEPQSSRKHFQVDRRGPGYVLVDLGSTNPTFLNHDRVQGEAPLRHGDRIRVGETVVVFEAAPDPLRKGARVGTVEVVEPRGRSEHGTLYLGRQGSLDREVLLEVVDPALAQDPAFKKSYEARARQAGALEHASVQAVFDTAVDREHLYTVFEACPGVPLARRLESGPAFDREAALSIVRDLAQALAHVHSRNQVHGLISPAAVMVDGARVKLTGLGEAAGARLRKHRPDAPLVALYASPEEARGQAATAASDLYSLGALALHLLTGQPPYEGATKDVLRDHASSEPVAMPASLEAEVGAVLRDMLSKDPAARATAADVERRLGALLDRREGSTRRPRTEAPPPKKEPKREPPKEKEKGSGRALVARAGPSPPSLLPLRLVLLATGYALIVFAASLATRIALRFL